MIQINNLVKEYDNGIKAVNGLSLNVEKNEMIAIRGASGSGKSTLIHLISGIDKPSSGEITVNGIEISNMNFNQLASFRNENIGYVMQDFGLIENRDVFSNVMVPLMFSRKFKGSYKEKVKNVLKLVGIEDLMTRKVSELSGGQKQRVAIARALINEPPVILADEPTGALDSKTKEDIARLFKSVNESGTTILIATHDNMIASACSSVFTICDGRII